jgi:hypothetical protein
LRAQKYKKLHHPMRSEKEASKNVQNRVNHQRKTKRKAENPQHKRNSHKTENKEDIQRKKTGNHTIDE